MILYDLRNHIIVDRHTNCCPVIGFYMQTRCFSVGLFINQFFLSLFWSLTLFRQQWQIEKGFYPLIIGVGEPGMVKTKAGNVALATAGSYPKRFYNFFTDAHNGSVSSFTKMGFQADDPTDPSEIGKAAKRFFSDGTSAISSIPMWWGGFCIQTGNGMYALAL